LYKFVKDYTDQNKPTLSDPLLAFLLLLVLVSSPAVPALRFPFNGAAETGVEERPVAPDAFAGVVSASSSFVRKSFGVGANTGENPISSVSKST
jgi:hypothetical protein